MIGPLWGFFSHIRGKCPIPLAIDQYFYLIDAIHTDGVSAIESVDDLLAFTKIFWLNDQNFKDQYELHFRNFFPWNSYLVDFESPKPSKVKTEGNEKKELNEQKGQEEIVDSDLIDGGTTSSEVPTETSDDDLVDFDLQVVDSDQEEFEASKQTILAHSFVLSDLSIMPFDVRNFAQRLRRKVETTEQVHSSVLDIPSMVREFTENGYLEDIIFEFEDTSHSNIVMFSDRFGSMFSYEYLDDHLRLGLRQIPYCNFEHYYFYKLPQRSSDRKHYDLQKVNARSTKVKTSDHSWNSDTWFFILSDAGGHSGIVDDNRVKGSLRFYSYLKNISEHVVWINPVPFEFLNDCTAKRLQMAIPMIYPDKENLNQMIKTSKSII